jgi:hypothetical protein
MPLRALRSVSATHPPGCAKSLGTLSKERPKTEPSPPWMLEPSGPGAKSGWYQKALLSGAMPRTRRREREEARVGEKEQSSSHARVSERRKALAILPAAQPFAGRRKKRISGRRVGLSRESPTLERDAAATTSARALSRRGAHVRVSPSLGASRPVATQLASLESDLGRG